MKMTLHTAALVGALALGGATAAQAVTIKATTPTWTNIVGGTNTSLNVANGSFTDARWGNPADGGGANKRSGLGFDPASPPSINVPADTVFLLGTLQHYNNPITGPATSVGLDLLTTIADAKPSKQTFSYGFDIDETTNATPCQYPSGKNPCADKITFRNLDTTSAFSIGGTDYTLVLSGFSTDGGRTFTDSLTSQEGSTNQAGLYAKFTAATSVPEPLSVSLMGVGLVAAGAMRVRRRF